MNNHAIATTATANSKRTAPAGLSLIWYRLRKKLRTPTPYLMVLGLALWMVTWWLFSEVWKLPRFEKMPGPVVLLKDWLAREPFHGISFFTELYYEHI